MNLSYVCSLFETVSISTALSQSVGLTMMSLIHDSALSAVGWAMSSRGTLQAPSSRLAAAVDQLLEARADLAGDINDRVQKKVG